MRPLPAAAIVSQTVLGVDDRLQVGIIGMCTRSNRVHQALMRNTDVDAVLITAPDHWHSPMMMAACAAGTDVCREKPVSNAIGPALISFRLKKIGDTCA